MSASQERPGSPPPGRWLLYLLAAIGVAGFILVGNAYALAGLVDAVRDAAHGVRGVDR